ncbi:hypothetical protein GLA29479_2538 [Lysobacter antibioticus]|uniref:XVIPCD domain-containing protein n=1 Tax=Lysobacter antibioticus TaxID=84531 RepID=UPI00071714D7|nr:XVIPCD domain-containing protein [Lysobacter antibioticus]ALN63404.1 hypothetical protein GLA29479_2538 [Lysobacter antibioticus]
MANPNDQLETAISKLTAQPGVTSDQVMQLRAAIVADAQLLSRLNQDAQAGHLRGFALQGAGGPANLIGTYDLQSGVVTLPLSSLGSTGVDPTADIAGTLRLQDMSLRFGHSVYKDSSGNQQVVTQEMVDNLQGSINSSPVLAKQVQSAVTAGPKPHLEHIAISPAEAGLGGSYDGVSKTLSLPAVVLQAGTSTNTQGRFDSDNLAFTIAHEVQHGFNHAGRMAALAAFDRDVTLIAQDSNPINDYTVPIESRIQAAREDEAKAQIAAWNALVSKHQKTGSANLESIYGLQTTRVNDFLEYDVAAKQVVPKAGLSLNNDLTLSETPGNVVAAGKHYFDKFPKGQAGVPVEQTSTLGPHREADNINYSGRGAISRAITIDRAYAHPVDGVAPQMHINMKQLRLEERLIERLGLGITPNPGQPQAYYDTSQNPPALHHFEHTKTGPNLNQHVPLELPVAEALTAPSSLTPAQSGHPDHTLYSQIVAQVKEQDRANGRSWDQVSERLSASLLSLAKENGVARVDHVVFSQKTDRVAAGENVFIVQGQLNDPAHVRAHMKTEAAVQTPEAVSFQKVEALSERSAQQALNTQQNYQAQEEVQKTSGMSR